MALGRTWKEMKEFALTFPSEMPFSPISVPPRCHSQIHMKTVRNAMLGLGCIEEIKDTG